MAFTYQDTGCAFHEYILCIFCNGWMDCRDTFYAVLSLYCCLKDRIVRVCCALNNMLYHSINSNTIIVNFIVQISVLQIYSQFADISIFIPALTVGILYLFLSPLKTGNF